MNIKQIIYEEVNDFDWADAVDETTLPDFPYVGLMYSHKGDKNRICYKVTEVHEGDEYTGGYFTVSWGDNNQTYGGPTRSYVNDKVANQLTRCDDTIPIDEGLDWIGDVPSDLPTSNEINQHSWETTKTITIFDYIDDKHKSSGIGIFFEDGRVVEFTNDDEVLYQIYKSVEDMSDDITGDFETPWGYAGKFNGTKLKDYDNFLYNKIIEIYSPIKITHIYHVEI